MSEPEFARRARSAIGGGSVEGVEVLRGRRPPLVDRATLVGLLPILLAGLCIFGAIARERRGAVPTDPASLLLTALAIAFAAQSVLVVWHGAKRFGTWLRAPAHALAIADEGLVLALPGAQAIAIAREDVLAVRERGHFWARSAGPRWSDVFLALRARAGRAHLAIPPVFERSPGELAERLMRWQGALEAKEEAAGPPPPELPSKVYDDAAAGRPGDAVVGLPHGNAWLLRGPYAVTVLGLAVGLGWLRMGDGARAAIEPWIALASLGLAVLVPAAWLSLMWRFIRTKKGLALVLAPGALLIRTPAGARATPWSDVARVSVRTRTAFSVLHGFRATSALEVQKKSDDRLVTIDQAFLSVPVEVVAAAIDVYRKGAVQLNASDPRGDRERDSAQA